MTHNDSSDPKASQGPTAPSPTSAAGDESRPLAAVEQIAQRVQVLKLHATAFVRAQRPTDASTLVAELLALDTQFLTTADPGITRAMLEIAEILLPTGLYELLEQLFLKAIQVLWHHQQATVADWFVPLNNLAAFYEVKGDPRARDQALAHLVTMADQLTAPLDERTANVFIHLSQIYAQAGHLKAAAILYRQLYRHVMTSPDFTADTRVVMAGQYGRMLVAESQYDTALEMYEQSLAVLESQSGFTDGHRLQLLVLTAQAFQHKGDLDRAELLLERARDMAERSAYKDSRIASGVYHNLASLYLQRGKRERYDEAERLLEHARDIVAAADQHNSSEYAGEIGQLAVIVEAKGEFERAEALYREALRMYAAAPDTNLQDFGDFLTDAGLLYLRLRRSAEAVDVFQRARAIRESMSTLPPLTRANTLSNLATAHFECGQYKEAIPLYRQAIDLRHQCPEFCAGTLSP